MPRWPAKTDAATEPTDQAAVATLPESAAPVAASGPIRVMAIMAGTYPNLGDTYARYRKPGQEFWLKDEEDLNPKWMRKLGTNEKAELETPVSTIPQTTGRHQKLNPFPPMP